MHIRYADARLPCGVLYQGPLVHAYLETVIVQPPVLVPASPEIAEGLLVFRWACFGIRTQVMPLMGTRRSFRSCSMPWTRYVFGMVKLVRPSLSFFSMRSTV